MRLPVFALIAVLAAASPLFAQPAAPQADTPGAGMSLTLDQCVAQALAKNFTVRIQQFNEDVAQAGIIIAQSVYDPVLGVSWQKVVNRSADTSFETTGTGITLATNPYSDNQETTVSASQVLPTGGQVTANYVLARDLSTPARLFLNPAYTGNLSLNVSQPLLAGAGLDYTRAAIDIARLAARSSALNMKSSVLTMVFNVETAYFQVISAQREYSVAQDNLKLAQQLLDENTIKRKTGVLTDLDVVQAQAGVATAQSQRIAARQAMENAEDTLLAAMGEREFKTQVGAIAITPTPDTAVSFDFSYKLARENGPSLALVQATIDTYKLDALRAKRNARPSLNVTGGAGYDTDRASYSSAIGNALTGPGYQYQAGLNLSLPWGLRQSRALYRQAMDNVRVGETQLDQADQVLTVQLRQAVRSIQANQESAAAADETVRLSEKQYELQKAKFDAGLATSYDVLQAQNQLESARVTQIQAQVNLRIAVADLHFLEGTSLEHYHINVKS